MPRFFLPSDSFLNDPVVITGADAHHISHSLRMRVGDPITLCDMRLCEYSCEIVAMTSESVSARVISKCRSKSEMPCRVVLYQGIAKGDKMDSIIQKAVELGVHTVVPVECDRCIAKINADSAKKKRERWQKIAAEAAGQCGRGIMPSVEYAVSFAEAVRQMKECELSFVCYEGQTSKTLRQLAPADKAPQSVAFLIGPEGGISLPEVELAAREGIALCGLGKRILRTETASGYVLSSLSFLYEL